MVWACEKGMVSEVLEIRGRRLVGKSRKNVLGKDENISQDWEMGGTFNAYRTPF